jgi:hypothetical protein
VEVPSPGPVLRLRASLVIAATCACVIGGGAVAQTVAKVPKACAAALNRTQQQQRAIGDIEARIDKERRARDVCGSQKACRKFDRRIEALQRRRAEQETRMTRYQAAEAKACAAP